MDKNITAREAASLLGISLATLYAYVSRGLLTASEPDKTRRKSYRRDDVLRLAARRADGKRGGHQVTAAMQWGVPVLETRISHIANGKLYYCGKNALDLAADASLEAVACLIWDGSRHDYFTGSPPVISPALFAQMRQHRKSLPLLEAAMAMLPLLASALPEQDQHKDKGISQRFHHAATLMRLLAALLLDASPSSLSVHEQLARAWGADSVQAGLIRMALVLLADHELNASTFTVRCVSATGASLAASLAAGLAALSGPGHGGGSIQALAMLENVMASDDMENAIIRFLGTCDPALAGFGHPLYPAGDPRAAFLLTQLAELSPAPGMRNIILETGDIASRLTGAAPNMDFALAALSLTFAWPPQATVILYAVARSAGWIAHAAEQADSGKLIRPRGRYIGKFG